jgi:hypothetical protein
VKVAPQVLQKTSRIVEVEQKLDESTVRVPASDVDAAERPLPTGSDIAHKKAPLAGVPSKNVHAALLDNVAAARKSAPVLDPLVDGPKILAQRLDEIEALVKSGQPVRCVFDLDNTLFDTRGRTLHALQVYDAEQGTTYAKDLTNADMKDDGRKTAIALKLPDDVVEAIGKVWDREFWDPNNLVYDTNMQPIIDIAIEAQKRNAQVVFLTGRTEDHGFRAHTMLQLERAGLAGSKETLLHKPSLDVRTAPYKEQEMRRLAKDATIGFFLTEGRRDMDHLTKAIDGLVGFLLDSTFEAGGPECKGVAVLPGEF